MNIFECIVNIIKKALKNPIVLMSPIFERYLSTFYIIAQKVLNEDSWYIAQIKGKAFGQIARYTLTLL